VADYTVTLRDAVLADADAGAALHRNCWREAYGALATDPALLRARLADVGWWVRSWRAQLESGPPRIVAEAEGELIGFAVAGPSRDLGPPVPDELYAVYVRKLWYGTGVGQALLKAVLGDRPASLWVLEDNVRARGFYERNGFTVDGAREWHAGLGTWEVRMVRGSMPSWPPASSTSQTRPST
jgi:GNAT superfamily N-acetyltransferase